MYYPVRLNKVTSFCQAASQLALKVHILSMPVVLSVNLPHSDFNVRL